MWYVLTEIFKSPLMQTFACFIAFVVGVRVVIAIVKKVKDSALVFVLFLGLSVGAFSQSYDPLSSFYHNEPMLPDGVENVIGGEWEGNNTNLVGEAKLSRLILNDIRLELAVLIGLFSAHILYRRIEA